MADGSTSKRFVVDGVKRVMRTGSYDCQDHHEAVKNFASQYPDFQIDEVCAIDEDGAETDVWIYIGRCEGCATPLFERDTFKMDDDGVMLCAKCVLSCESTPDRTCHGCGEVVEECTCSEGYDGDD